MGRSRGLRLLLNSNAAVSQATQGCSLLLLISLLLVNDYYAVALQLIAHIVVLSEGLLLLGLVEGIAARAPTSIGEASSTGHWRAII